MGDQLALSFMVMIISERWLCSVERMVIIKLWWSYSDHDDNYDDPTVIMMIIMICGKSGCVPNEARPGPRLGPAHIHHSL